MTFFKKDEDDEFDIVTQTVPVSTVYRWYLYDTGLTDDINGLAEMIGLNPISEEGEAKEKEESDERLENIDNLYPFLESIADLSAKVFTSVHLKELSDNNGPELKLLLENIEGMEAVYKAVALSTLMGAFSIANDLGIIHHDVLNADVLYLGDDEDEDDEQ